MGLNVVMLLVGAVGLDMAGAMVLVLDVESPFFKNAANNDNVKSIINTKTIHMSLALYP